MRHLNDKKHLNRTKAHRKAALMNISNALFTHKRVTTTLAKAKYARRFVERMITFARREDLAARRHVRRFIRDKKVVKNLFDDLGPHFKNRNGGYTRIIKLGTRRGDAAPMALLELVGFGDIGVPEPPRESKSRLKSGQEEAAESLMETEPQKPIEPALDDQAQSTSPEEPETEAQAQSEEEASGESKPESTESSEETAPEIAAEDTVTDREAEKDTAAEPEAQPSAEPDDKTEGIGEEPTGDKPGNVHDDAEKKDS